MTATTTQSGNCGNSGCPASDSFTQQGYSGSFQYLVAAGAFAGMNLLSGTFSVNGTPANSGATLGSSIQGTGASYLGTQTGPNPNGVVMSSDFLSFGGVSVESAAWAVSGLSPSFAVNFTATNVSLPLDNVLFLGAAVGTFASEPPPEGLVPEPASLVLMGSALIGLGLWGRKRFARG